MTSRATQTPRDRDGVAVHINPTWPTGNRAGFRNLPPGNVAVLGAGRSFFDVHESYLDREAAVLIITALTDAVEAYDYAHPETKSAAPASAAPAPLKKGDRVELVGYGKDWDGVGTVERTGTNALGGVTVVLTFRRARHTYGGFPARYVKRLTPEREAELKTAAELAEAARQAKIDADNARNREETARKAEEQRNADRLAAHSLVPGDLVLIGEKPGTHRHGGAVDVHAAGRAGSVVDTTPFDRDRGRVRIRYVTSFGVERIATIHVASFTRAKAVPA